MPTSVDRRYLLQAGTALALTTALPRRLFGAHIPFDDIPRSDYGFATTCDEVAAGYDLEGLTVFITGCNSGLGYESLRTLVARGAHVIGTARTLEKAEQACATANARGFGKATPLVCELTDMKSVVAATQEAEKLDIPVDVLICNAGIMALPKLEQVDVNGVTLEKQFVVNHLGHYLLTRRMMPQIEAAKAARIVMLSSIAYTMGPKAGIEFDNLSGDAGYSPFKAYGQSKLANLLTSNELSHRYVNTSVTSNAVHPGMVATNLGRYISGKPQTADEKAGEADKPLRKGFKYPDQGAATQVYCAIDRRLKGVSGYYFEDCNPVHPKGSHAGDAELMAKLWDVSEQLVSVYM